jgi:hypothetical protein
MAEEALVLGREEGVDQLGREFVVAELDPPLAGEGLDRLPVDVADDRGEGRLVGQQRLRRGQAAGEDQQQQEIEDARTNPPKRLPASR